MNKQCAGITLVELVFALVIISIAVAGTLLAITTATRASGDPLLTYQAVTIAESYLEEITQKDFPVGACPATTGGRATYFNICQYVGLPLEAPTDQLGNPISGLSRFKVAVAVNSNTAVLGALTASAAQVVRIDVTVTHPHIAAVMLSAYRTRYP
jgi:MSHA pilin protein MshD